MLSKFLENTYSNLIFSQYNIFQKHSDFFFQSVFGSLLNNCEKLQSNQVQHSLCWSSPCFSISLWTQLGPLQCFATYFRKSKEIVVLRPKFQGYIISCESVVRQQNFEVVQTTYVFNELCLNFEQICFYSYFEHAFAVLQKTSSYKQYCTLQNFHFCSRSSHS